MYAEGQGVPQDDQQALYWYRKTAEQGDADAQLSLGLMCAKGQGTPQDFQQAVFWYRKAAEQGNPTAQFNLGLKYANGQGVPRDDQQAYFWWLLASASGELDSVSNRDIVEARLTPEQRAAARSEARQWKPHKP
jgi:TPR repeat protein